MTKILCLAVGVMLSILTWAQESELEKKHGFKDLRLESEVDSIEGVKAKREFKEKDEFPATLYELDHPDYKKIGEVKIKEIELKAYKGLLYEIRVQVERDPRIMKGLEMQFGKAEYDMKNETYFWKAPSLILKFRQAGKNSLELLYSSIVIHKMMKDDKQKKVEDISNDF
jgi:hypothetical protein